MNPPPSAVEDPSLVPALRSLPPCDRILHPRPWPCDLAVLSLWGKYAPCDLLGPMEREGSNVLA